MPTMYTTSTGDKLDDIAWRKLGDESALHAILAANPALDKQRLALPAGLQIVIPSRARLQASLAPVSGVRLWG